MSSLEKADRQLIASEIWRAEYRRSTSKERNISWYDVSDIDRERYLFVADAIIAVIGAS